MRKTDINQYTGTPAPNGYQEHSAGSVALTATKRTLSVIGKALLTVFMVMLVTGAIVGISMIFYIASLSGESIDYDLRTAKLNQTSYIWVMDENGEFYEDQEIQAETKSEWVDFEEIPDAMKKAMIAIEDRRFNEHHGVDWIRTGGAVLNLVGGHKSGTNFGGSTLTQQLIKNLTDEDEVSLTRKLKEIFRALNFEKRYSKDEILEMYLNVVNYGSGCLGVQAAANLYFDKDIQDCSVAECAAIAGITQNPSAFTPLLHPQANRGRREIVLKAMLDQGKLTQAEYDQAMKESATMTFAKPDTSNLVDNQIINNWYYETMLQDVAKDLAGKRNISEKEASRQLRTQGMKVYCAMDKRAQDIAEKVMNNEEYMPTDTDIQLGIVLVGYDGRILASVGQRGEKEGNLWMDYANNVERQTGSCIKPISVYAPALEHGLINFSTVIDDEPIEWDVNGDGVKEKTWPPNADGKYHGKVTIREAIKHSYNAVAAQVLVNRLTMPVSLDFLLGKVGITSLNREEDLLPSALATGGGSNGVTVREIAASFQIFGNGGVYHKPYTYYYVKDDRDNVILDNNTNPGIQAISSPTSTIMRKLMYSVVETGGTGPRAAISGTQVFAKTGTAEDTDSWFVGGTPYAVAAVWEGHPTPAKMSTADKRSSLTVWKMVMQEYIQGLEKKDYEDDPNVIAKQYCAVTGLLADSDKCPNKLTGYYTSGNMPGTCDGNHDNPDDTSSVSSTGSSETPVSSNSESQSSESSELSSTTTEPEPDPSSQQPESEPDPGSEPDGSSSDGGENNHTRPQN